MTDLSRFEKRSKLRLTTRGRKSGQPRTVTIWFVVDGPNSVLVQHARGDASQWYRNLCRTPEVTIDFGEGPIRATARPITDRGRIDEVLAAIRRKHWLTGWLIQFAGTEKAVAAEIVAD